MLKAGTTGLVLAFVLYVLLGLWAWAFDVDTNIDTGTTWPLMIPLGIIGLSVLLITVAGVRRAAGELMKVLRRG